MNRRRHITMAERKQRFTNISTKTEDRATRTLLKTGVNSGAPEV